MKARTYKKLLRLNQDEQERLRYLSKSTGLNQEQGLQRGQSAPQRDEAR